jgi:predicted metal-binding protein
MHIGSTARETLAKAYGVDADDVEVEIRKFRNGTIKALICIEGECNLYDVCEEVGKGVGVAKLRIEMPDTLETWFRIS